jgi:hypothetical protein
MIDGNPKKWVEFAAKVQADVIAQDAANTGPTISADASRKAISYIRQDLVLVASHLTFLNQHAENIHQTLKTIVRLLWAISAIALLILIQTMS